MLSIETYSDCKTVGKLKIGNGNKGSNTVFVKDVYADGPLAETIGKKHMRLNLNGGTYICQIEEKRSKFMQGVISGIRIIDEKIFGNADPLYWAYAGNITCDSGYVSFENEIIGSALTEIIEADKKAKHILAENAGFAAKCFSKTGNYQIYTYLHEKTGPYSGLEIILC